MNPAGDSKCDGHGPPLQLEGDEADCTLKFPDDLVRPRRKGLSRIGRLLTQVEFLNHLVVARGIGLLEVVLELFPLGHHHQQATA
jgi:hypothetical protein